MGQLSAEDLDKILGLLAAHRVPGGLEMAQFVLASLAKHRVKVVIGRTDGSEATLTLTEVIEALGHDI